MNKFIVIAMSFISVMAAVESFKVISMVKPTLAAYDAQVAKELKQN